MPADYRYGIAVATAGLGRVLALAGRTDDARPVLVEARERFEELNVAPGLADVDLEDVRRHLAGQLDDEEFARCLRAGGRRTRPELIDIATAALHTVIDAEDDPPLASTGRR